jgi:hypothetical protein
MLGLLLVKPVRAGVRLLLFAGLSSALGEMRRFISVSLVFLVMCSGFGTLLLDVRCEMVALLP